MANLQWLAAALCPLSMEFLVDVAERSRVQSEKEHHDEHDKL